MRDLIRSPFIKILSCYLILVIGGLIPVTDVAKASFIIQKQEDLSEMEMESAETLRAALEDDLIIERLSDLGMTSDEVIERISQLEPEEREILLKHLDSVQAGGDYAGSAFVAAIYIYLVFIVVVAVAMVVETGKGLSKAIKNTSEEKRRITFSYITADSEFSPYEGRMKILFNEEPKGDFILLGTVNAQVKLNISNEEKRKKILIKWMKTEAAEHGADTMTFENEPESSHYHLTWSARCYKTKVSAENTQ